MVFSRSSAEAEYRSMASIVCEVLWVRWLLGDLGVEEEAPIPFMCDNEAAMHIAANLSLSWTNETCWNGLLFCTRKST